IRSAAAELDLIHGGYYRLRPGAIAFYCSPENHPLGWDLPYRDGTPEAPRQLVGEVDAEEDEGGQVSLAVRVANWIAAQAVQRDYDAGRYRDRYPDYVRDQERALHGRPEDAHWIEAQLDRLRRHAAGELIEE